MLDKDEIASILSSRIWRSTGYHDSTMTTERTRVLDYYNGLLPKPMHKGNSKYVSNDVFDSVESMTAQLLETFCGNLQPVKFIPQGAGDVELAREATEIANFVMDRQNDGFTIKEEVIKDALLGRMGVAKIWWEDSQDEEELSFEAPEGATDNTALSAHMAQNPEHVPTDADVDPTTGVVKSATFKKTTDNSQVRIVAVPSEEFGISAGSKTLEDANLVFHCQDKTVAELEAMGYDPALVKELPTGRDWITDQERLARSGDADPSPFENDDDEQTAGRKIEYYECYTKLDINETDATGSRASQRKLYKVIFAGGKVIAEPEMVKRLPFKVFVPLPRQHTIWGSNFADKIIPIQNLRTALMRGVADHTVITTNPRWQVVRGGLANPNELLENRIGGIVNVKSLDSVAPLPVANLNPFVFQAIALLDEDKEETTGISKLSQGLNKDALSKQNSGDMVEQLVNMSQIRQKVIARRFGEHFLGPLAMEAYALVQENAQQGFEIEVAGKWTKMDPSRLVVRQHIAVDFALGYGEQAAEAKKYATIFASLQAASQSDPTLAQAFGTAQKYTCLTRGLLALGIRDTEALLADPSKLPPPPPNPMPQLQQQKMQADIAMQQAQAQAGTARVQREAQKDQMQHQLEMLKLQMELQKTQGELALKTREQVHKEAVDAAELRMAASAPSESAEVITPKG